MYTERFEIEKLEHINIGEHVVVRGELSYYPGPDHLIMVATDEHSQILGEPIDIYLTTEENPYIVYQDSKPEKTFVFPMPDIGNCVFLYVLYKPSRIRNENHAKILYRTYRINSLPLVIRHVKFDTSQWIPPYIQPGSDLLIARRLELPPGFIPGTVRIHTDEMEPSWCYFEHIEEYDGYEVTTWENGRRALWAEAILIPVAAIGKDITDLSVSFKRKNFFASDDEDFRDYDDFDEGWPDV